MASLTAQISSTGRRLQNRRRLIQVRGATLRQTIREQMTDPALLLWASGMGFLIGELTRCQASESSDINRAPDSNHSWFDTALNLIKLATWTHTLFAALPDAKTQPCSRSREPSIPSENHH